MTEVDLNKKGNWEESIKLIGLNINQSAKNNNLGLVALNNNDILSKIKKIFNNSISGMKFFDGINKLIELNACEYILLIVQKGKVTRSEMLDFNEKLKLLNKPLIGWILISTD